MSTRVLLAVMAAAPGALLGGLASRALGLHSFWPGVVFAYVVGVLVFLRLSRRF